MEECAKQERKPLLIEIKALDIPEEDKNRIVERVMDQEKEIEVLSCRVFELKDELEKAEKAASKHWHRAESYKDALVYFVTDHNGEAL